MTETALPPAPVKRGGQFRAEQGPDGKWTIFSVPIMGPLAKGARRNRKKIGVEWMRSAIERANSWAAEGYFAPAHVLHHEEPGTTIRVGYVEPKDIGFMTYRGNSIPVILADLTDIPDRIFARIDAGELPYRSVEVFDWDEPEINSLAILTDEVPFFRFSVLTIGEKSPFAGVEHAEIELLSEGNPTVALLLAGDGSRSLFRAEASMTIKRVEVDDEGKTLVLDEDETVREDLAATLEGDDAEKLAGKPVGAEGDEKPGELMEKPEDDDSEEMAEDSEPEELADDAEPEDVEELQEDEPEQAKPPEEMQDAPDDPIIRVEAKLDRLIELLGGDTIEDEVDSAPAEEPSRFKAPAGDAREGAGEEAEKLAAAKGELVALRGEKKTRKAKDERLEKVRGEIRTLKEEGFDFDEDEIEKELLAFDKKGLLPNFLGMFRTTATKDPKPTLDELEETIDPEDPEAVLKFHAQGPEALAAARSASREYDELKARGLIRVSRERHIEISMEAAATN